MSSRQASRYRTWWLAGTRQLGRHGLRHSPFSRGGVGAGGGVAINNSPAAYLSGVTFSKNQALGGYGGGTTISDANSGGFAQGGGLFTLNTTLTGTSLVFDQNSATGGSSNGSGIDSGSPIGAGFADAQGGAACFQGGTHAVLSTLTVTGNTATGGFAPNGGGGGSFGGGLYAEGVPMSKTVTTTVSVSQGTISGNKAVGGNGYNPDASKLGSKIGYGSYAQGGGVFGSDAALTLAGLAVVNNSATGGTGTVNAGTGTGGGVGFQQTYDPAAYTGPQAPSVVINSVIARNSTVLGGGTNKASAGGGGGGLSVQGTSATLIHVTADANTIDALQNFGVAIACIDPVSAPSTQVSIYNSIVSNHPYPSSKAAAVTVGNATLATGHQPLLWQRGQLRLLLRRNWVYHSYRFGHRQDRPCPVLRERRRLQLPPRPPSPPGSKVQTKRTTWRPPY